MSEEQQDLFTIIITACNRGPQLTSLLEDLQRERRSGVRFTVRVYDDASEPRSLVAEQLCEDECWAWNRSEIRHGKQGYWRWVSRILEDGRCDLPGMLYVMLPDDVRLCRSFLVRAAEVWRAIGDPQKRSLNLLIDQSRQNTPCWTGTAPERCSSGAWRTQWVDGLMLFEHSFLDDLGYRISPQGEERWQRNPRLSSGVGGDMSTRLVAMGRNLYRVGKSLVVHVKGPSIMNPKVRLTDSMAVVDFIDGDVSRKELEKVAPLSKRRLQQADQREKEQGSARVQLAAVARRRRGPRVAVVKRSRDQWVEASLASIPNRSAQLKQVIASLLPQVDVLRVYLNGYSAVPECVKQPGVQYAISQDFGDNGDAGKFWWSDKAEGYQLTCDDDLVYPKGYVQHMVDWVDSLGQKAAVSLHGLVISEGMSSFYKIPRNHHWRRAEDQLHPVNMLGTGVLAYHSSLLQVSSKDFELPNMADIWFGLLCQKQQIPCAVLPRRANWIKLLSTPDTIYDKSKGNDTVHTEVVKRVWPWKVFPLPRRSS